MSSQIQSAWSEFMSDAAFAAPADCSVRLTSFDRKVRRRNLIEYVAGGIAFAAFVAFAVMWVAVGEWAFSGSLALLAAGIAFVLVSLHRRASSLPPRSELDCTAFLRAQLERQRAALAAVPAWYIGPLVPGIVALYLTVAWNVAAFQGWPSALSGIATPFLATVGFFVFVIWLNRRAARLLEKQISELDKASPNGPQQED